MSVNIQKFKKEIDAVHFDGITNVQEIAQWCGGMIVELIDNEGRIRNDMYAIDIPCPGGYTTAGADCYIFKDGPSFFSADRQSFEMNFDIINA